MARDLVYVLSRYVSSLLGLVLEGVQYALHEFLVQRPSAEVTFADLRLVVLLAEHSAHESAV